MQLTHPSRVHNEETTVIDSKFESYGSFLRQSNTDEFNAAHRVYSFLDLDDSRSKADLLESCRSNAWFTRHIETGEVRVAANACHLRWCPLCSDARRNYIGHSVAEWIATLKYPKLMTLTVKHRDMPLWHQIEDLYRYFVQLRKRRDFSEIVTGGVWFFQVKRSKTTYEWHPHIHCVIDGKYMPRTLLRRLWFEITTDSKIIDIRSVKDPQGCALEVARYAAKPGPLSDLDLNSAVELVTVMHGRRICGTWGVGRSVSLRPPRFTDKDKWQSIGSWSMVMQNRKTDPSALQIFSSWKDKTPLDASVSMYALSRRESGDHVFVPPESSVLDKIYSDDW